LRHAKLRELPVRLRRDAGFNATVDHGVELLQLDQTGQDHLCSGPLEQILHVGFGGIALGAFA